MSASRRFALFVRAVLPSPHARAAGRCPDAAAPSGRGERCIASLEPRRGSAARRANLTVYAAASLKKAFADVKTAYEAANPGTSG